MKHEAEDASLEPDWDIPLTVTVTSASVIDTVFATAFSVHTGTESCVNAELAVVDIVAPDDNGGNFSRYVRAGVRGGLGPRGDVARTGRWS